MASIQTKLYDQTGKELGMIDLSDDVFGVNISQTLIHQVVVAQHANAREVIAHTKGRADVRGGGRKPWKQKGTGRARHGSIRSPLWIGGGVTFGPTKERNFSQRINKKMKQAALKMVLSDMVKDDRLVAVDKIVVPKGKTQEMQKIIKKLPWSGKRVLVSFEQNDQELIRAVQNIPNIMICAPDSLNVVDVLKADAIIITQGGIKKIEKIFTT